MYSPPAGLDLGKHSIHQHTTAEQEADQRKALTGRTNMSRQREVILTHCHECQRLLWTKYANKLKDRSQMLYQYM